MKKTNNIGIKPGIDIKKLLEIIEPTKVENKMTHTNRKNENSNL